MKKYIIVIISIIMIFAGKFLFDITRGDVILDEISPNGKFSIIVKQRDGIFTPLGVVIYGKVEETGEKDKIDDITIAQDLRAIVSGDVSVTWTTDNEGLLGIQGETESIYYHIGLHSNGSIYRY